MESDKEIKLIVFAIQPDYEFPLTIPEKQRVLQSNLEDCSILKRVEVLKAFFENLKDDTQTQIIKTKDIVLLETIIRFLASHEKYESKVKYALETVDGAVSHSKLWFLSSKVMWMRVSSLCGRKHASLFRGMWSWTRTEDNWRVGRRPPKNKTILVWKSGMGEPIVAKVGPNRDFQPLDPSVKLEGKDYMWKVIDFKTPIIYEER